MDFSQQPVVVEASHVSMRFNLAQEKTETLKEYLVKMLRGKLMFNEFYALKDVSFTVHKGESVALIGRNGSGKSTMLKVVAGVMYPSQGGCTVHGSIAPMIELGAGFDMDLTARENVYLNGAVLGYDRAYMDEHFHNIIDFAELWDFIDVPVKNFSSGMVTRLGLPSQPRSRRTCWWWMRCLRSATLCSSKSVWNACTKCSTPAPRCCLSATVRNRCASFASVQSGWTMASSAATARPTRSAPCMKKRCATAKRNIEKREAARGPLPSFLSHGNQPGTQSITIVWLSGLRALRLGRVAVSTPSW